MLLKQIFRCFTTLIFIKCVTGSVITAYNEPENSFEEEINILKRIEEMLKSQGPDTLTTIDKKFAALEDSLRKASENIEVMFNTLDNLNGKVNDLKEAPNLEGPMDNFKEIAEKIPNVLNPKLDILAKWSSEMRLGVDQTLKTVRSLPESLNKINSRLEALEASQTVPRRETPGNRRNRATLTGTNLDLDDLEMVVSKLNDSFYSTTKLEKEKLLKNKSIVLDDMDKTRIDDTGCQFMTLDFGDLKTLDKDNKISSFENVAYDLLSTYRHVRRADFETHFAIRSSDKIQILLWEVNKPDLSKDKLRPDYMIDIGETSSNDDMIISMKIKGETWQEEKPSIISADKYQKFYIKMYNDSLEFGSNCDKAPLHIHKTQRSGSIATIAFVSYARGAKILFDCPARTCAESP